MKLSKEIRNASNYTLEASQKEWSRRVSEMETKLAESLVLEPVSWGDIRDGEYYISVNGNTIEQFRRQRPELEPVICTRFYRLPDTTT